MNSENFFINMNYDDQSHIDESANEFKGACYGDLRLLRPELVGELDGVLAGTSEEAIQTLIAANPYLLRYVLPSTGHHGIWAFPKPTIRTHGTEGTLGLIPDFLVAARNSLGYSWHIVELKTAVVQFSNTSGKSYNRVAADAIAQCSRYLAHFGDYIDTVRANVRISELVRPCGAILIIGDGAAETEAQRRCRDEFHALESKLTVASYDRMRRGLRNDLRFRDRSSPEFVVDV